MGDLEASRGQSVGIGLNGPLLAWPGLGVKLSVWLGPPDIQRRMHDLRRFGFLAVSAARASIQPEAECRAARGGEPHHLPSGQLRDMAIRATHGGTPYVPDGGESKLNGN